MPILQNDRNQGRKRNWSLQPDINITPFLDILLVLLIVFIVASPLSVSSVQIKLPEVSTSSNGSENKIFSIVIDKSGNYFVQNKYIFVKDLPTILQTAKEGDENLKLQISADEAVPYKFVMEVMSIAKKVGIRSINMLGKVKQGDIR